LLFYYDVIRNFLKLFLCKTFVGSVAERVQEPFLWQPCDHDCVM